MGYLDPYLINNPSQIVSCNDLYPLLLKVQRYQPKIQEIIHADSVHKVGSIIKSVVPDVEDFQFNGKTKTHYLWKFRSTTHRENAKQKLENLGYRTITRDRLES